MRFTLSVRKGRARRSIALGLVCILACLLALPVAALTDRWAAWAPITGVSNDYSTTMAQRSAGFPVATMASDSKSNVQLPSGASAFLGAGTPPGAKYGSSTNQSYAVLRAKADTATTPSTTTYTFDEPDPGHRLGVRARRRRRRPGAGARPRTRRAMPSRRRDRLVVCRERSTTSGERPCRPGRRGDLDADGKSRGAGHQRCERVVRARHPAHSRSRSSSPGGPASRSTRPGSSAAPARSAASSRTRRRWAACPVEDTRMTLVSPYGEDTGDDEPGRRGRLRLRRVRHPGRVRRAPGRPDVVLDPRGGRADRLQQRQRRRPGIARRLRRARHRAPADQRHRARRRRQPGSGRRGHPDRTGRRHGHHHHRG